MLLGITSNCGDKKLEKLTAFNEELLKFFEIKEYDDLFLPHRSNYSTRIRLFKRSQHHSVREESYSLKEFHFNEEEVSARFWQIDEPLWQMYYDYGHLKEELKYLKAEMAAYTSSSERHLKLKERYKQMEEKLKLTPSPFRTFKPKKIESIQTSQKLFSQLTELSQMILNYVPKHNEPGINLDAGRRETIELYRGNLYVKFTWVFQPDAKILAKFQEIENAMIHSAEQ